MRIDKKKIKKVAGVIAVSVGIAFVGLNILASKKKKKSIYDDEPEQKNPLEGKKVIFIEDENDMRIMYLQILFMDLFFRFSFTKISMYLLEMKVD